MIYEHLVLKTQINMQSNISDQPKVHTTGASQKEKKRKGIDDPQKRKKQKIQPKSSNYIECDDSQVNKTNLTKQIFVIDDFLGRHTVRKRVTNAWKRLYHEQFRFSCSVDDSCYIIATCREEISKTSQFTSVGDISKFGEFNLSSNLKETMNDKIEIASCHMNPVTTQMLFAEKQIQNVDRFHTLCFLYSHLLETENIAFFKNPNCVIEQEFQEIGTRSEPCYIGLALLTIYDGTLTKPLLDLKKNDNIDKLIRDVCLECNLRNTDIKLSKIQQDIDIIVGRYVIDEVVTYSLVHSELYDILLEYFMKKIPRSLIAYGSNDFIQSRVRLEGSNKVQTKSHTVVIKKDHENLYFNRLMKDIERGQLENVFGNIQVSSTYFQEQVMRHVKNSEKFLEKVTSCSILLLLAVDHDLIEFVRLIISERNVREISQMIELEKEEDFNCIDYDDSKLLNLQLDNDQEIVLMLACLRGRVNIVKLLLENKYDVDYQNSSGKTPLHLASLRGNTEVVNLLLGLVIKYARNECDKNSHESDSNIRDKKAFNESDIDIQDYDGNTALHIACKMKHKNIVHLLLQKWTCTFGKFNNARGKIDLITKKLYVKDNQGRLALHMAAESGSVDIFEILFQAISMDNHIEISDRLSHLSNLINARDKNGKTCLYTACENGHQNVVDFLLKYSCCNIDIPNYLHETPLFCSCRNDKKEIVDVLIKKEAKVNIADSSGRTPLHVSVEIENKNLLTKDIGIINMVQSILKQKDCDVNKKDKSSNSALHLAILGKNVKIVETILKAACNVGCDINQTNSHNKTPLLVAVSNDATNIVKLLINNGCDLHQCNSNEIKAFHLACKSNYNGNIIKLFLKRETDFDLDTWDRLGRTGLHYAVFGKNLKAIKLLRKTEININKQDEHKNTAIHNAYQCFQIEIVNELLRNTECDINLSDETGKSILHIACERNDISMLRNLLRKDCAINAQDGHARTPMHIAMSANYTDIFTLLVNKSDLNAKYMNGWTPLHIACREQRLSAVNILLQAACDVNIQDNTGKTPLHIAAGEKDTSIVEKLLELKCNVNLCDKNGQTALAYARENHNRQIVKLFFKHLGNELNTN